MGQRGAELVDRSAPARRRRPGCRGSRWRRCRRGRTGRSTSSSRSRRSPTPAASASRPSRCRGRGCRRRCRRPGRCAATASRLVDQPDPLPALAEHHPAAGRRSPRAARSSGPRRPPSSLAGVGRSARLRVGSGAAASRPRLRLLAGRWLRAAGRDRARRRTGRPPTAAHPTPAEHRDDGDRDARPTPPRSGRSAAGPAGDGAGSSAPLALRARATRLAATSR